MMYHIIIDIYEDDTMKNEFILTKNEIEIMEVLWSENRPLSGTEIIELSPTRSWNESSIFILTRSLLKKNAIEIDGFVRSQTNYGRAFVPTLSADEYAIMQINVSRKERNLSVTNLIFGIIDTEEIDSAVIDELERLLKEKKRELEES